MLISITLFGKAQSSIEMHLLIEAVPVNLKLSWTMFSRMMPVAN
jgi:hypothetical protein